MTEAEQVEYVTGLVAQDEWMMRVLEIARSLALPDWWIAAGFVRNKVWDVLHGYRDRTEGGGIDVDVIYFNPLVVEEEIEKAYERRLRELLPNVPWSVKNQARMHLVVGEAPHVSSIDAVSKWVETATCVAVKLTPENQLVLSLPAGADDLLGLILKPNPKCAHNPDSFYRRVRQKSWLERWPRLKIVTI